MTPREAQFLRQGLTAMNKKLGFAFRVLIAGLVALLGSKACSRPDLVYSGKSLRSWLQGYDWMRESPEIDQAVRSIGTDALPTLLTELRAQDSPPWVAFITFVEKHRVAPRGRFRTDVCLKFWTRCGRRWEFVGG